MNAARPKFRVHTLLALMAVVGVLLALVRESLVGPGVLLGAFAGVLGMVVVAGRRLSTAMRLCSGVLVGLLVAMLLATARDAHNRRAEVVLASTAALGGGLGGVYGARPMRCGDGGFGPENPSG
jgi:hypothetical protein